MDFQEVLTCLEDPIKCAQFIRKLKNAGKNSEPFLHVQSAMVKLGMNKPQKGTDQTNILQHTFKFLTPRECFTTFRLVSKQWQNAVETLRFNQQPWWYLVEKISYQPNIPHNFGKYLKMFRKLKFPLDLYESKNYPLDLYEIKNIDHIKLAILNNMKKLNCIDFEGNQYTNDSFVLHMLHNSRETLQKLKLSHFIIPDVAFPKLNTLTLCLETSDNLSLSQFETYFPRSLKNMERIEKVKVSLCRKGDYKAICEYIATNYNKQCVSASAGYLKKVSNLIPVQFLQGVENIDVSINNCKYAHEIRYLEIRIKRKDPMKSGWENYRHIFDQCSNLKVISLSGLFTENDTNLTHQIDQILPQATKTIWEERISYFQARGIQIMNKKEMGAEHIQKKLAKEAGISWRFHFY